MAIHDSLSDLLYNQGTQSHLFSTPYIRALVTQEGKASMSNGDITVVLLKKLKLEFTRSFLDLSSLPVGTVITVKAPEAPCLSKRALTAALKRAFLVAFPELIRSLPAWSTLPPNLYNTICTDLSQLISVKLSFPPLITTRFPNDPDDQVSHLTAP